MRGGFQIELTARFRRDYESLSVDIKRHVDLCIIELGQDPLPNTRRAHAVTPRGHRPTIYTVDVTANKAYKLSFHVADRTAVLRRVGTHRQIDRSP